MPVERLSQQNRYWPYLRARRQDACYRYNYGRFDLRASFAGFTAYDFMAFLMGMVVMGLAFLGLKALQ